MSVNDEQLEGFVELLENMIISMQERIEKLEKQQAAATENAPFHLSMPMREFASRGTVGFKGNSNWPMPRESNPQLET